MKTVNLNYAAGGITDSEGFPYQGEIAGWSHKVANDGFRDRVETTIRMTLRDAVAQHGGARSVADQMGFDRHADPPPGRKSNEWHSAVRTIERHVTEGGTQQRGTKALSGKYQALYEKVLGKDVVDQIREAKGGRAQMPSRGYITITVTGEITVEGYEETDKRERTVKERINPPGFKAFFENPIKAWGSGWGGEVLRLDSLGLKYEGR